MEHRLNARIILEVLADLFLSHAPPEHIRSCNGPEFTGQMVDLWAYHHKVRVDFSRPATPTDNAHIESFNGSLRDECLNVHRLKRWLKRAG